MAERYWQGLRHATAARKATDDRATRVPHALSDRGRADAAGDPVDEDGEDPTNAPVDPTRAGKRRPDFATNPDEPTEA